MPTEREWMEMRERLRYEVEHPNTRVNQIHRNEWPKLWAVIDEILAETDEDTWIGNPEDRPSGTVLELTVDEAETIPEEEGEYTPEELRQWADKYAANRPNNEVPEVPVVATFNEDDDLVGMEELPEIPEPGESPARHSPIDPGESETKAQRANVITSGPIPPPAKRQRVKAETYEEFSLPENPE